MIFLRQRIAVDAEEDDSIYPEREVGSKYTWVAGATLEKLGIKREKKDLAFVMANGRLITRSVGFAIVRVDKAFTVDEVVFAEKGDMHFLGARSLEGLNLAVDSRKKKLVAAGPLPVAATLRYVTGIREP